MKIRRLFMVGCMIWAVTFVTFAQETGIPYTELSQSRTQDGAFVLGNPDAPVTVILFSDFICPACLEYFPVIRAFISVHVVSGAAQLEYRFLPSMSADLSTQMAQLAECVEIVYPGRFWEAFDQLHLLILQRGFNPATLDQFVQTMNFDEAALAACRPTAAQVNVDMAYARSLGVTQVPTVLVRYGDGRPGFIRGVSQPSIITLDQIVQAGPPQETPLRDESLLRDDSLLSADPCGAPCWRQIVPGETRFDEATELVRADERFRNNVIADNPQTGSSVIRWSEGEGRECCRIFSDDGEIVSVILLLRAPDATAAQLLEVYGDPEFMTFSPVTDRQTMVSLIYPERRFVAYLYADAGDEGEIHPQSEVIGTLYMDERNLEAYLAHTPRFFWAGYGLLADYAEGGYDVLPEAVDNSES